MSWNNLSDTSTGAVKQVLRCPGMCGGTGKVSRPPWIAGDQPFWADTVSGPYPCPTCNGVGLIVFVQGAGQ